MRYTWLSSKTTKITFVCRTYTPKIHIWYGIVLRVRTMNLSCFDIARTTYSIQAFCLRDLYATWHVRLKYAIMLIFDLCAVPLIDCSLILLFRFAFINLFRLWTNKANFLRHPIVVSIFFFLFVYSLICYQLKLYNSAICCWCIADLSASCLLWPYSHSYIHLSCDRSNCSDALTWLNQ